MDWSETLKILNKDMTQSEIAAEIQVKQSHVSHLISGRRKAVSYELGKAIEALCSKKGIEIQTKTPAVT